MISHRTSLNVINGKDITPLRRKAHFDFVAYWCYYKLNDTEKTTIQLFISYMVIILYSQTPIQYGISQFPDIQALYSISLPDTITRGLFIRYLVSVARHITPKK